MTVLANNPSLSLVSPSVKLEIMIGAIVICNNKGKGVIRGRLQYLRHGNEAWTSQEEKL